MIKDKTTGEVSYEGCVLRVETGQTWTHDPIFWTQAHVWTGSAIETVSLRHDYTDANREATVDATPEVREAAVMWLATTLVPKVHAEDYNQWVAAVLAAHEIKRGSRVEVVKGRTVRHGVQGDVFWIGNDQYAPPWQHRPLRVGFVVEDGTKLYTAITNLIVLDVDAPSLDEYTSSDDEAFAYAVEEAKKSI